MTDIDDDPTFVFPLKAWYTVIDTLMATGQSRDTAERVSTRLVSALGQQGYTLRRNEPTEAAEPQDEAVAGPDPRAVDIVATVAAAAVARLRGVDDWMEDDEQYVVWSTKPVEEDGSVGVMLAIRDYEDNLEAKLHFTDPQDAIMFACQVSGVAYQAMLGYEDQ